MGTSADYVRLSWHMEGRSGIYGYMHKISENGTCWGFLVWTERYINKQFVADRPTGPGDSDWTL